MAEKAADRRWDVRTIVSGLVRERRDVMFIEGGNDQFKYTAEVVVLTITDKKTGEQSIRNAAIGQYGTAPGVVLH